MSCGCNTHNTRIARVVRWSSIAVFGFLAGYTVFHAYTASAALPAF